MNRNIILTVIVLVLFSALLNSALIYASHDKAPEGYSKSVVAISNTIWVPDNYTTIQEAIDKANEGETIFVRAGTYYEHVVVDKALSLIGENKHNTIIDGNGTKTIVYVIANNITLSGFTIQNGELGAWFWYSRDNTVSGNTFSNNSYGIFLSYSSNNVVTGNTVSYNQHGIYLSSSSDNTVSGNTISNNWDGIFLWRSSDNTVSGNTVSNNWDGIYLSSSSDNTFTGNTALNNSYGKHLYYSSNNVFSGDTASNNSYGIFLSYSHNNDFSGIDASYNQHGIYLDGSSYNTFTGNTVSLNNDDGIRLYHSNNNFLYGNNASYNGYGIYVSDSDNNNLAGNTVSYNQHGIYFYYSRDNILTGNTAINNRQDGVSLSSSINNIIFHNNFINNAEPPSSTDSANSWDNGAEGNYWTDYDDTDANWDGICDTPYPIDEYNKDNYPLMAKFLQFNIATENQSYRIDAVSNSTISNFQYLYDSDTRTNAISFKVNGTESKGFCRISIPHALIEPPYIVKVDHNSPLYFKIVRTNGTHTWLYFTYDSTEQEAIIMHTLFLEQLVVYQWAILGLLAIAVILLSLSIRYYRMSNEQKKVIQTYERALENFPLGHPARARALFIKDVMERKEKIEKFEKKYGIKIQPATTLEDIMKKLGVQKES